MSENILPLLLNDHLNEYRCLGQQFSTGVPQEFLKHAVPDYLSRDIDLFPLDCQIKKKMTTVNTAIAVRCEWIKIYICVCVYICMYIYVYTYTYIFDVLQNVSN